MEKIYNKIYELVKPFLNTRKNDIHVEISLSFALKLLEKEAGDPEVVIPAVLLHDLGWWQVPEELQLKAFGPQLDRELQRIHEVEGVRMAREVLGKFNYEESKMEEILLIIDGHDTRLEAVSQNDRIVKDADKLFRYSPRGFEIDAERFGIKRNQHRKWLSECIEEWFFTPTAKLFAREALQVLGYQKQSI
ncbi:HD domain-containing protein [Pelotomaculum terephthalicicum JT]|uniref:HD domain-containing protein n=1 Tax=Pelotomaculum TaxID=191373 RepID=UPI0009CD3F84|nr:MULTISPECIES: HD domain-containing protein [Pelotomaculum]MCG9969421.1 HD domain-containing protein [Pelotomaculum terephthalicicum JT]OPX91528.1 MAG: HD domain protein [Pelotomaculum sp. PtaB.Bin117]OPY63772.1 MAG: HD domain protein [Pelotomaculum sp. PtaU1.Bin065]